MQCDRLGCQRCWSTQRTETEALSQRTRRESGAAFATPVDAIFVSILGMLITSFAEGPAGADLQAQKRVSNYRPSPHRPGLSPVLLLAKSFSSGSAALTSLRSPFDQAFAARLTTRSCCALCSTLQSC